MTEVTTEESTMSTAAHHEESSHDTTVEVLLSRPSYRLGGSVVGTIRLTAATKKDVHPRAWFQSARVYVAGRCRVDGRWHNPVIYKRIYGQHPHLRDHMDLESSSETVCFWATNVVNLLELEERTVGQWKDVNPKAMVRKSGLLGECEAAAYEDHWAEESTRAPLESQHLAFTFRVDLPLDIPHSAAATCVRYSYSAVVSATTLSNEHLVVNAPFSVLTPLSGNVVPEEQLASAPRIRLGSCTAMAHSAGLPCHVSATDLYRPKGATTVNRNVNLLSTIAKGNVQTLRIADPSGEPCCILTALGCQVVNPGGHLLLQFDFPPAWVPCHQVSVCLQGEEVALYEDGSTNRTRAFLLDTAHEMVESGHTERISLNLHVPLDCPCTIRTDLVKITAQCRIDISVGNGAYTNLQFHLPCTVAHAPMADETNENQFDDDVAETPLDELVYGADALCVVEKDSSKPASFQTKDIRRDLKVLSLQMVDAYVGW